VAYGSRPATNLENALHILVATSAGLLRDQPVIEGAPVRQAPLSPAVPATFRASTDTRVDLAVQGRAPGWLVLADTFHPGWKATVDGHPVTIHAANGAFRAIPVPTGRHRIVFAYAPGAVVAAAWVSSLAVLGALVVLVAGALARWRRRSDGPDSSLVGFQTPG
jgi:hypothetical protein